MTEGLFVLTTLFVAYVIYVIVNEKKAGGAATKSAAASMQPKQQVAVEEKPKAAATKAKPAAAKPVAAKKTAEAPAPVPEAIKGTGLKDPKTAEVATTYSNYRFTKRWIKDALVAEKLVEKVYKNDELNADVEAKIKAAIIKLEGMKKYQA
jgi:hypothetical protein